MSATSHTSARGITKSDLADLIESLSSQEEAYTNRYGQVTLDLGIAHTDKSASLRVSGRVYKWLTVTVADSEFVFKLDSNKNPEIMGRLGTRLERHLFTEIFYSNPVGTGEARILVGWFE